MSLSDPATGDRVPDGGLKRFFFWTSKTPSWHANHVHSGVSLISAIGAIQERSWVIGVFSVLSFTWLIQRFRSWISTLALDPDLNYGGPADADV